MGKVDFETFAASQNAIRDYIYFRLENDTMHDARILISSMGETKYSGILKVIAKIETNNSSVDIFGDPQFEQDYFLSYNNEYQVFTFINGTLLIKCTDKWGNQIEIDITGI